MRWSHYNIRVCIDFSRHWKYNMHIAACLLSCWDYARTVDGFSICCKLYARARTWQKYIATQYLYEKYSARREKCASISCFSILFIAGLLHIRNRCWKSVYMARSFAYTRTFALFRHHTSVSVLRRLLAARSHRNIRFELTFSIDCTASIRWQIIPFLRLRLSLLPPQIDCIAATFCVLMNVFSTRALNKASFSLS